METLAPSPLTRLKIQDAPPEFAPKNPPERFAQVISRQEKSNRPKKNAMGLEREEAGANIPLPPKKKAKQESPDPVTDPEVTALLTPPTSNTVLPSPPSPQQDLKDPTLFPKPEGQTPTPALASTEVKPQDSLLAVDLEDQTFLLKLIPQASNSAMASTDQIGPGAKSQPGPEDFLITSETGPASAPAAVQPLGALRENPSDFKDA